MGSVSLQESFLRQRIYSSTERLGKPSTAWSVDTRGKGREEPVRSSDSVCAPQMDANECNGRSEGKQPRASCELQNSVTRSKLITQPDQDHAVWKPWELC